MPLVILGSMAKSRKKSVAVVAAPPARPPVSQLQVTAAWDDPLALPLEFADQVHVQRVGDRYILTVGQGNFPLVGGKLTEALQINIRPLHRYVISTADLRRISDTIASLLPLPENGK